VGAKVEVSERKSHPAAVAQKKATTATKNVYFSLVATGHENPTNMDQRIIHLYDEYTHKPLTREEFIKRLITLTGSTAAAMAVLPFIEVNYAQAQIINPKDERLATEYVQYKGDGADIRAYVAKPKKKKGKLAAVVIIHENRGLNPHIEDVTRRMALEGFLALAPDALSPLGGTPEDADKARGMFQQLDTVKNLNNFVKAFDYLQTRKDCNGKFGTMGFCWGGGMANQLAVNVPTLKAAIPFYGRQAELTDVPKINAALQLHYAGQDERINAGIAAYEEALKTNGKKYELFLYEGAQHAFNNDTAPSRYNEAAAKLAWQRSVDFLRQNLK
jgi:carboxymethylenebutenolidase